VVRILFLLCFFLSSCAYKPLENFQWEKTQEPSEKIVFVKHDDPNKFCRELGVKVGFMQKIIACALSTKDVCFIVTNFEEKEIPIYIKAHEEKHCLGWSHN